jgi:hypothetical protein
MTTVRKEIELDIHVEDCDKGAEKVFSFLAGRSVRVLCCNSYRDLDRLVLLVIVDDPEHAQSVLQAAGYRCQLEDIVLISLPSYRPGIVARFGWLLDHAGVNTLSSRLTTIDPDGFCAVFKTTDNQKAARVLDAAVRTPLFGEESASSRMAAVKDECLV